MRKIQSVRSGLISILLILGFSPYSLCASFVKEDLPFSAQKIQLLQTLDNLHNDSTRIFALFNLADLFNNYGYDPRKADSIIDITIKIAEKAHLERSKILAYCKYVFTNDLTIYHAKAFRYSLEARKDAETCHDPYYKYLATRAYTEVNLNLFTADYQKALESSQLSFLIAFNNRRQDWMVQSYLDIGRCFEGLNLKIEAIKNYIFALDLAEKIGKSSLLDSCYTRLSVFYRFNALTDKALDYSKKKFLLAMRQSPLDSVTLMWTIYDTLSVVVVKPDIKNLDPAPLINLISYAIRKENQRLKQFCFAMYRTYLIEHERFDLLYNFYTRQFPEEFVTLSENEPNVYLRLKAYFFEYEGKVDSAISFLKKAELIINKTNNPFLQSTFYYRWGQLCERNHLFRSAIYYYEKSYYYSTLASINLSFRYVVSAVQSLKRLYIENGNARQALKYSNIYIELLESKQSIEKKEQVIILDLKNAQQKRELSEIKEKQEIERMFRKRQTERNMMGAGIGVFLVISFLLYRNFRTQKRSNILLAAEKRKSEDLLLNILPKETADELKQHGAAKAKRIQEVTVMFTDFKDFTLVSEKMDAEELVRRIHYYFSEFDNIIGKYRLEKIKIIGDSYMCAGGLPAGNTTHATDVINAALEFLRFVEDEKKRCLLTGEPYFELRIGVHSGPVIAGIVGTKKFAYDIWGDTVNTASRLESSGEVNKINISGKTFQMVKDHYRCTYRGKIPAKNKGEIDMYFVESKINDEP